MLLGGDAGHGLEPVGKMGSALGERPILHGAGDDVGNGGVKRGAFPDCLFECAEDILGQPVFHNGLVKDHGAEQLRNLTVGVHVTTSLESMEIF